jgi:ParB family chromosome partitioning protein
MAIDSQLSVIHLALNKIVCDKQVREFLGSDESLAELGQSLRKEGFIAPVQVMRQADGKYRLIVGGRRVEAARRAGFTEVPAIVLERDLSKGDELLRQLAENIHRQDLAAVEKAKALDGIMREMKWTASQLAVNAAMSNATVTRLLSILTLPPELQARIGKELPASAAYELSQVPDPAEQAALAERFAAGTLTRDTLRSARKAKGAKDAAAAVGAVQLARATAKLGDGRSVTVCAKGLTLESFLANLEDVRVRAREARGKNLSLDTFLKVLRDQSRQ